MLITFAAWAVTLASGGLAVLCAVQAVSVAGDREYHHARESAAAAGILACAAVCALGVAGVVPGLAAVVLGAVAAFTALGCVWYEQGMRSGDGARLGAILGEVVTAARMAVSQQARETHRDRDSARSGGPTVIPGLAEHVPPARDVPPAAADPALRDPLPDERDITPAGVDAQWAALVSRVSGFEPEDAAEFMAFYKAQCAGMLAYAEAMGTIAENCGEAGTGLDPAITQAQFEAGDQVASCADGLAMVRRRLIVVYGEQLQAAADGLVFPFEARKFFGDGDVAA